MTCRATSASYGAAVIEQQAQKRDQIGDDLLEARDVEIVVIQGDRPEGRMHLRRDVGDHADEKRVRKEARLRPVEPREDDRAGKQIEEKRNQVPGTMDHPPIRIERLRQMRPCAEKHNQIRHAREQDAREDQERQIPLASPGGGTRRMPDKRQRAGDEEADIHQPRHKPGEREKPVNVLDRKGKQVDAGERFERIDHPREKQGRADDRSRYVVRDEIVRDGEHHRGQRDHERRPFQEDVDDRAARNGLDDGRGFE